MPWTVDWQVEVDGISATDAMRPFLQDITVTDKDGTASDTCALVLDDRDAQLRLPRQGARVAVLLEGVRVFTGIVDGVRSQGKRGEGRTLRIGAKGFDSRGKATEPQRFHADDASLDDFLGRAARQAGLTLKVDPAFAGIVRDYWSAETESVIHLGHRLARELGGTFKVRGTQAVLAQRGADLGLPTIEAVVGDQERPGNVIGWDIEPLEGRRVFTRARTSYFDRAAAAVKHEDVSFDANDGRPEATNLVRSSAHDASQARGIGEARKTESEREAGTGTLELDLAPEAQAEGLVRLKGARAGVDGTYRMAGVTHKANRSTGALTNLDVKQPGGGAGKDERPS